MNLSHILCAAVLDPFEGQYYRLCTVIHQGLLCPALSKLFCYTSDLFLTKFPSTRVKPTLSCIFPKEKNKYESNRKLRKDENTLKNRDTRVN